MTHPPRRRGRLDRALSSGALRSSAVRYLVVGGSAFLVDLGLLALLHEVLGVPVGAAGSLAFLGSFAYTYSMQRLAFASVAPHGTALVRYAVLVAANTLATGVVVHVLAATAVGWVGGKVVATALTTVWNYFLYRHWVFPVAAEASRPTAQEA